MLESMLIVVALLAGQAPSPSDSAPASVVIAAKLVQARIDEKVAALAKVEAKQKAELERINKGRIDTKAKDVKKPKDETLPMVFPSKKEKAYAVSEAEAEIAATHERIAELRDGRKIEYGSLTYPTKVGDFGTIYHSDSRVNVAQVIDGSTMLINVHYRDSSIRYAPGSRRVEATEVSMMVKGVSTSGATDEAGFDLPMVFRVSGTTTYATVGAGSKTVFVLEPIDTKAVEAYLAAKRASP